MCWRFDRMGDPLVKSPVLDQERREHDQEPGQIHRSRDEQRREEQKVSQWPRHSDLLKYEEARVVPARTEDRGWKLLKFCATVLEGPSATAEFHPPLGKFARHTPKRAIRFWH